MSSHSKRPGSKAGNTTTGAGGGVRKPLPSSSGSTDAAAAKQVAEAYVEKLRRAILSGEKLDKAVKVLELWVGEPAKKKAA